MSEQAIVERIIADAQSEAQAIIADAEKRAEAIIAAANMRSERKLKGETALVAEREKSILDVKDAAARLDGAKILLEEKRAVIDTVYTRALENLCKMGKAEAVHLFERLLKEYADEGDEIAFADNFTYAEDVCKLDIVKQKKLKISAKKVNIVGGCLLLGKICDKNLSFTALLDADREQYQAEIAAKIFSV